MDHFTIKSGPLTIENEMILKRMTYKYQEFYKIDRDRITNKVTFATVIIKGTEDFS